jgi:hypothetical protein
LEADRKRSSPGREDHLRCHMGRVSSLLVPAVGSVHFSSYDEGTAMMPVVEYKRGLPKSDKYSFIALDEDGHDLPKDW